MAAESPSEGTLPTAADFLLRSPLYEFYDFSEADEKTLAQILAFKGALDAHCVWCGRHSIFHRPVSHPGSSTPNYEYLSRVGVTDVGFKCSRNSAHTLWFRVTVRAFGRKQADGSQKLVHDIGKIGQWPTVADLHTADVGKYRKLLGDKYSELTRAIGLASHGVGIGSWVYLRRIFESLIEEAHGRAQKADAGFPEEDYQKGRMEDKIDLLRDYLPPFLVQNRQLYNILSTGIHQLREDQCLQHFDTVRVGIEFILDERLEALQREEKLKQASAAITKVRGELRK